MDLDREHWLAERKTGIGSSDAAAILGLSPWRSALEVYLDKVDELPAQEETEAMRWGLRLEDVVALAYEEKAGAVVTHPANMIDRHSERRWQLASIDRMREDGRIVELKTASEWVAKQWGREGTDEIPEAYVAQVQHQMSVIGAHVADVAVLIGGNRLKTYTVDRSDRFIARMVELEAEFWDRVKDKRPPDPDFTHPGTLDLVKQLWGITDRLEVTLDDPRLVELVEQYGDAHERAKAATEDKERAKAELLFAMKDAAACRLFDGTLLTRKTVQRKGHEVKPSEYQDFRIKLPKIKKARAS